MEGTAPHDSVSYPSLLVWHWYFLAWAAGLWGARYFLPSLAALGAIVFFYVLTRLLARQIPEEGGSSPIISATQGVVRLCVVFAVFVLGLQVGSTALSDRPFDITKSETLPQFVLEKEYTQVTGTIREVQTSPDRRIKFILSDASYTYDGVKTPVSGDVVWTWANRKDAWKKQQKRTSEDETGGLNSEEPSVSNISRLRPMVGETITLRAKLVPIVGFRNKSLWNSGDYWQNRGVFWRMYTWGDKAIPSRSGDVAFWTLWREKIRFSVSQQVDELAHSEVFHSLAAVFGKKATSDAFRVIPALVFGDKYSFSSKRYGQLSRASLSHSFALSGMHLAIVSLLISVLCSLCVRNGRIFEHLSRSKLIALTVLPAAGLYVWIGGGSPSLERAFIMLACWCVLMLFNRPRVFMDGLFWALAIMTVVDPLIVFDLRLQLSALAIVAMIVALPLLSVAREALLPEKDTFFQRIKRSAFDILFISISIQLVLYPVTVWNFNELSLWNILNVIWLPLLGMVIMPLLLCGLAAGCLTMALPVFLPVTEAIFTVAATPIAALFAFLDDMDKAGFLTPLIMERPHWVEIFAWYGCIVSALVWWSIEGKAVLTLMYSSLSEGAPTWENKLFTAVGLPLVGSDIERETEPASSVVLREMESQKAQGSGGSAFAACDKRCGLSHWAHWAARLALSGFVLLLFLPDALHAYHLEQRTTLNVLDVGQGQSLLLTFPDDKRMLIDGGGFSSRSFDVGRALVVPCLTRQHDASVQWVMATHPDTDHIRGLFHPLAYADVKGYFATDAEPHGWNKTQLAAALKKAGLEKQILVAGDVLIISDSLEVEVLHPPKQSQLAGNNKSLVLRLVHVDGKKRKGLALLTGDIEVKGIEELLRSNAELKADVLILPHRGSASSFSPELYDAVTPKIAVASCGFLNKFKFPSPVVMDELHRRGIQTMTTAMQGEVELYLE